ncbi:transcriptional regulator [Methanosarcina lacustris Z-7289]|uniref:Transcriptional regulator n=2 Tax=Methanosarcina lacustris TaxID=170861 RepID=A0A0E3WS61_9EURY|nr:transcriptional regulator [Methanosarcina lacustris Z-7289]
MIDYMINEENIQIFKALSEETRYKIIKVLLEGEKCACEIPDLIGRTQSNTSMHLAKLQDWDIIKVRKDGKKRLYSIDNEKVRKLLKLLEE